MGFICRALFWLVVVAAFLPRQLADEPLPPRAEHAPIIDAAASAAHLCESKPEVCAAGEEAAKAAHAVGDFAATTIATQSSRSTRTPERRVAPRRDCDYLVGMADPAPNPDDDIAELVDEFSLLEDWEDRYRHVIALGEALEPLPADARTEASRVRGCVSQVWLVAIDDPTRSPRRLRFLADSDAHIVRGLAAILLRMYSGRTPDEILSIDAEQLFAQLGLDSHLSPQRSNGLRAMVERIRALAASAQERA